MKAEDVFEGNQLGLDVLEVVSGLVGPGVEVRATKTQVALRRKHGFAYLWAPGQHLKNSDAEVVLSIALGRHDESPRFKEVAHPSPKHWIHHLEIHELSDIDDEVGAWLAEAEARAGSSG
jgi:hypothetical protein